MLENKTRIDNAVKKALYLNDIILKIDEGYKVSSELYEEYQLKIDIVRGSEERELGVVFSNEFLELSKRFYHVRILCGYEFCDLVEETKFWREDVGLPERFVVLADDGTTIILLETQDDPEKPSPVWNIAFDDIRLFAEGNGTPPNDDYTKYPSFVDFFEHLLESEMERIKEDLDEIEDPEKRKEVEEMLAKAERMLSK